MTADRYVVISNSADGEVLISVQTREELNKRLGQGDDVGTFYEREDFPALGKYWNLPADGKTGTMIFPLDSLVVPVVRERIVRMELPE